MKCYPFTTLREVLRALANQRAVLLLIDQSERSSDM